jgi:LysM repeat protein
MSSLRQVVLGFLAAILSSGLILGGISIALLQDETGVALAPTATPVTEVPSIEITVLPGEPTLMSLTPTPTETFPPPVCLPPEGWVQKAVGPDETMQSLADAFGLPVEILAESNCLLPSSQLMGGMILSVPAPAATATVSVTPTATQASLRPPTQPPLVCGRPAGWQAYYVRRGDTLFSISQAYYTTVVALQRANCLRGSLIHTGQLLYVPNVATRTPVPSPTTAPTLTPTATITALPPTLTPTRIPPTAVPPTSEPPTAVPPTAVPTTAVPPTDVPTATASPTEPHATTEPIVPPSIFLHFTFSTWKRDG